MIWPFDQPSGIRKTAVISSRGFTILELLIVLVIAVAMVAMVGPNFANSLSGARFRAAIRDLSSGLRYVRGQAISKAEETTLFLDVDQHYYSVSGREKQYSLPDAVQLTLDTAETEITGEGQGNIRFFPDGSSTGGRITLEYSGRKVLIDVNWLTGQIATRDADD